jgi:hypothetical protein
LIMINVDFERIIMDGMIIYFKNHR